MSKLNNSTNAYSASNYQVATSISNGNYSSIQDAINDAVANGASSSTPVVVWIQAGTYIESLTLAPYVNLSGASDPSTGTGVIITGNAIYPDPSTGNFSLTNVGFKSPNSNAAISFQSGIASEVHLQSVSVDAGSGIGLECTGSGMNLQVSIGSIQAESGGICKNITNGFVEFFSGLVNFTDTASTISGGTLRITGGDISDSFNVTGGTIEIFSSIIQSGSSFPCVTLGAATSGLLSNCSLGTSSTYLIAGTGNLVYTNLLALQSGTPLDPGLTLSPLPTIAGPIQSPEYDLIGSTSGIISILPQAAAGTYNFNMPTTAGTAGYFLTSDGGGAGGGMTWTDPAASGSITIDTDNGSAVGSTISLTAQDGVDISGSSVTFSGSGSTVVLNLTDGSSNTLIGNGSGNGTISGNYNVGLGYNTLAACGAGSDNTAIGTQAMQGNITGGNNVAVGFESLFSGDSVSSNTTVGWASMYTASSASNNTAFGFEALQNLDTGTYNVAIGVGSGVAYTTSESSNVLINNSGTVAESNVLRIGVATGTSDQNLNSAYICGIQGISVTGAAVLVSSSDQLGIAVSSKKYKENIEDMGEYSSSILKLRPVTFNPKGNPDVLCTGLIAEEVDQVMASLVVYDRSGDPQTVKYHELPAMLLNELQKALKRIEILEAKIP